MRVAELARQVGVRPDTVRYYERAGLLAPPPRTSSGYRQYPASSADRILFIRDCQRLGLTLREISSLLEVRDTGECPYEPADQLLRRHIAEIDSKMTRLARLRSDLWWVRDRHRGARRGPHQGHHRRRRGLAEVHRGASTSNRIGCQRTHAA